MAARAGARSAPRGGARSAALKRLVRAQVAALNARDLDRLVALYAEDAVLEFPASRALKGRAAIRAAYARHFQNWDETVVIDSMAVSGQRVAAQGAATGRHHELQLRISGRIPIPLKPYRHAFSASWDIRGGKIRRHQVTYDAGELVRQILEP
jgi:ketosteroid isomerase-like protein